MKMKDNRLEKNLIFFLLSYVIMLNIHIIYFQIIV